MPAPVQSADMPSTDTLPAVNSVSGELESAWSMTCSSLPVPLPMVVSKCSLTEAFSDEFSMNQTTIFLVALLVAVVALS